MKSALLYIIINELMAANVGAVMSPAYNFDSWVELYNPTEEAVDLAGMYLSDDGNMLTRWQLPADIGSVPAKGFKVVWLGSNDILTTQAPFHLDCDGGTIYLSDQQGQLVSSVDYPQAMSRTSWARTTDGGDAWGWTANATPGKSNAAAVFAAQRLDAPEVSVGSRLFQEPFTFEVAIPQGTILMYTTNGTVPTGVTETSGAEPEPTWTEWIKNGNCEGQDAGCFIIKDGDKTGSTSRITNGAGIDGSRGIRVHAIDNPAHDWDTQFFIHTPHHVWQAGEPYRFHMWIRADKPAHITAQTQSSPGDYIHWEMLDNSYNIGTQWQEIAYEGTISEAQSGGGRMQTIAFNLNCDLVENNFYFDDISWESFGTADAADEAYRSRDGKFTVNGTTSYVFRLFQDEDVNEDVNVNRWLPSVPVTRSFIQTSNEYTIPIVSIVGDERYFTDPMWGIDVKGQNGIPGNSDDDEPKNWNQPWDRPVNFSYISPTDGMFFNQDVNVSIAGGWTRSSSPRSMKLKSNKAFDGLNHLDYAFFPQKPYIRSKTLLVRNGGNDVYSGSRFMDPALATIMQRSGIDIDVQSFVQVVEYVNGKFRGVLNLREPNNDKFVYANFGYDDDEIDMFENSTFKNGTNAAYKHLCELAAHINDDGVYDEVKTLLDIDEFANYMAAELFIGNDDWPENNVKAYRSQDGGRFRFVCFDLDYALNAWGRQLSSLNNYKWVNTVQLFLHLLQHDGFRRRFIDTFCIMGGSVFERERATSIVNELADAMRPMSQYDGKLPDNSANKIKDKLNTRNDEMTSQLQQYAPMQLSGTSRQSVQLSADTEGATLLVNGIKVPYAYFNGHLFAPVSLEAKAPAGYTFAGWSKASASMVKVIGKSDTWKYYDNGQITSNSWRSSSYNDAAWKNGAAPLGYNMEGVQTTISYGSDPQRKNPTTYFRKSFSLSAEPGADDVFQLHYQVDDGCVVWVNGTEAGRVNMRSGAINYDTFSSTYAENTPLTGSINLPPTLFRKGNNVIAIEVHNTSYTSGDLFWAGELFTTVGGSTGSEVIASPCIDLPHDPTIALKACFTPLTDTERSEQGITPVRINEVSAANDIYVNEYFKRNDWVELYNTTCRDINVEGMYLSDDEKKPQKYQITRSSQVSTVIPAHGYLIIWCDKLEPASQLHAPFKLAAEGGIVMLSAADGSWTDRLSYGAMKGDESVGRYPDGSPNVITMNIPTIARTNIMSSYATHITQPPVAGGISNTMARQQQGSGQVYNLKGQAVQGPLKPGVYIRNGRKILVR